MADPLTTTRNLWKSLTVLPNFPHTLTSQLCSQVAGHPECLTYQVYLLLPLVTGSCCRNFCCTVYFKMTVLNSVMLLHAFLLWLVDFDISWSQKITYLIKQTFFCKLYASRCHSHDSYIKYGVCLPGNLSAMVKLDSYTLIQSDGGIDY